MSDADEFEMERRNGPKHCHVCGYQLKEDDEECAHCAKEEE